MVQWLGLHSFTAKGQVPGHSLGNEDPESQKQKTRQKHKNQEGKEIKGIEIRKNEINEIKLHLHMT